MVRDDLASRELRVRGSAPKGVVVWSALSIFLTAQSPVPHATAPPYIGGTHSRGLCTTVRDRVAPMIAGLMKSDEIVLAGHRTFAKMGHDTVLGSPDAMDLDRIYLGRLAAAMAHNLGVIDKLLADQKQFPKKPATDDERIAQTLATQIRAVADQQRKAVDLMNGVVEMDAMGRMQTEFPKGGGPADNTAAFAPTVDIGGKSNVGPTSFVGAAGIPMQNALPGADPRANNNRQTQTSAGALATSSTASGHTLYDQLNGTLEQRQSAIAHAEYTLTPTVVGISIACKAELEAKPSPSP